MSIEKIFDNLESCGVLAVLVIDDAKDAVPLAQALLAGGVFFDGTDVTNRCGDGFACCDPEISA